MFLLKVDPNFKSYTRKAYCTARPIHVTDSCNEGGCLEGRGGRFACLKKDLADGPERKLREIHEAATITLPEKWEQGHQDCLYIAWIPGYVVQQHGR